MPLAWGEGTADSYHAGLFLLVAVGLQSSGNLAKWRRECEVSSCWQEKKETEISDSGEQDWVEKVEIQAFSLPVPLHSDMDVSTLWSVGAKGRGMKQAAWTAVHSASPPHHPMALQRLHSPAVRHLLFQPEGWGHQTPAHHLARPPAPGMEEGRAELQSC